MKTQNREKEIMKVSAVGIAANIFLAIVKIYMGFISGSIAIASDAVNNLTDSSSSLITIIGTKLAQKKPDREHPFGMGRIEYMTSLVIGIIVLVTGAEMLLNSIKNILNPTELSYSAFVLSVMASTIIVKLILGNYTEKSGKKLNSTALVASGLDAKTDAVVTGVALLAAIVYMLFGISLDAYAGAIISIFVIKTGLEVLKDTLDKILGQRADENISDAIYEMIEADENVISAHDLILNNYGPNTFIGSINVEIDHNRKIGDIYPILHRLQMKVYNKCKVYLVFGIYAVDKDSTTSRRVWEILREFKEREVHCLGYHGVVIDEVEKKIYFDVVVDFEVDRNELRHRAGAEVKKEFDDYEVIANVDLEFA